jgi:hypothetical protein
VALAALVAVCLVVTLALVLRDDTERARLGTPAEERPDRAAATTELLFQLQSALREGSAETELTELADPDVGAAAQELSDLAANIRDLRVDRLVLRYLDVAKRQPSAAQRELFGDDAWVSEVQLSWRLRGVDRAASTLEVPIVTDWHDDRAVFVTSRFTEGYQVPLWFTEPLVVRRGPSTLVMAEDPASARSLDKQARIAVTTVRRTLPGFDDALVVEAPDTAQDFRTAAGLTRPASKAIAAVTTATDGSVTERAPVHVFLNPEVFGPLGPVGRQIVVSHEATHVALGATMTNAPLWLTEGIADYVALVGTSLPDTVLAAQIRALVRKDGPPRALPGAEEFDGSNRDIGAWYEASWLAVRLLAETYGRQELLAFYEQVETEGSTGEAFREVLGTSARSFRKAWQDDLAELAG